MPPFTRAILIVLDSAGIGALPDAAAYVDEGSNTLKTSPDTRDFDSRRCGRSASTAS